MTFGQGKIWYDGEFVPWQDATCHVLSHAIHYGSSIFEGVRCYEVDGKPCIFRLSDHVDRLFNSAKIYRMDIPFSREEMNKAVIETVTINDLKSCYIRPAVFRGCKVMGLNPLPCPVNCIVAAWSWGRYLGEESMENGVSVKVSSWRRPAPDTHPSLAKAGGNYLNSQLMKMEALEDDYDEAIALDSFGFVSEGSGENIFVVNDGKILTPAVDSAILPGITRDCVMTIARNMGISLEERTIPREALYIADEVFFSGTAAEIVPVTQIDNLKIGTGRRGPITEQIQSSFQGVIDGTTPDSHGWLTRAV